MRDVMAQGVLVFGALVLSLLGAAAIAQHNDLAFMAALVGAMLAYLTQFTGWLYESGYRGVLIKVSWAFWLGSVLSSLLSFFLLFGA